MHLVIIELTNLILVGTRIIYQATGEAWAIGPWDYNPGALKWNP